MLSNERIRRLTHYYVISCGIILLFTGLAKIFSASGKQEILYLTDPVIGITFRYLMLLAGVLELIISAICIFSSRTLFALGLIVWMSTSFLIYRFGLWYVGWQMPCVCMGTFTQAIHLSTKTAGMFIKGILVYLLVGSITLTFFELVSLKKQFLNHALCVNQKSV